jgi:alkanesulfonate monooxygenase SsuD/methylene tetrahydromethanopterin reductase-like flavin-dependent oxidoreductase (luciferase family)
MTADRPNVQLGLNIDPGVADPNDAVRRAEIADRSGIDLIAIQDHPYIAHFFDTWTLLTMLAAHTERVRLGTNVSPLALRPPVMLAKMAASLDVLSGGRVELGIGTGGFRQAIEAFGGRLPPQSEIVPAFAEAVRLIRGLWSSEHGFSFEGRYYQLKGTRFGPKPAHPIPIWVGATKPRMLRLAGRLADGVLITNSYVPEAALDELNQQIDEGAAQTGRAPSEIRRGYNLMGAIDLPGHPNRAEDLRPGTPLLSADGWAEWIIQLYRERRMDTFYFWPLGDRQIAQLEVFAAEVSQAVHAELD